LLFHEITAGLLLCEIYNLALFPQAPKLQEGHRAMNISDFAEDYLTEKIW
jgi:hypothetical protein